MPPYRSKTQRMRGLKLVSAVWVMMLLVAIVCGPGYVIATLAFGLLVAACWWNELTS